MIYAMVEQKRATAPLPYEARVYGTLWYGAVRYGKVTGSSAGYDTARRGFGIVECGTVRYDMVRYVFLVRSGLIWYGTIWR